MGRLALLPSDVAPLYLTLQQSFTMGLPAGPALLIPYGRQAGVPDSPSSSVYPGTFPGSIRDLFHCWQMPQSSGLAGTWLTHSLTPEQTLELACQFPSHLYQTSHHWKVDFTHTFS